MEKKLKIIKEKLTEPLQELNIIIDKIEFKKESNYNFLIITLDKVNGIDLDTIVEATKIINPMVDKIDLGDEAYILDVISKEKGVK